MYVAIFQSLDPKEPQHEPHILINCSSAKIHAGSNWFDTDLYSQPWNEIPSCIWAESA